LRALSPYGLFVAIHYLLQGRMEPRPKSSGTDINKPR
jgi:hypothetical protein